MLDVSDGKRQKMPRFSFVKTEVSSVKMENSEGACPTP